VPDILLSAGEASGDLHAGGVAAAIRALRPDWRLSGIGGAHMQAAGVELMEDVVSRAVMGFVEVLAHLPRHYALLRRMRAELRGGSVKLVICVDYPGFNMKLAAAAHAAGVPVLYYITPQVWAWGARRLPQLARTVTKAAVILSFEEALLRQHHIDATFVGHPLLDRAAEMPTRSLARAQLRIAESERVLALFPGSRAQEVARHLDAFVAAAREVERRVGPVRVLVAEAPDIRIDRAQCPYPVISAGSFVLLRAADAALCKSGTTTLEAAVAECPLVVAYRTSAWTYALARRVVTIPRIALVNVLAGRELATEFVQRALEPSAVADALVPLLDPASPVRAETIAGLRAVRAQLGSPGAAARVAALAVALASRDPAGRRALTSVS
jgi:lipid-A-disaccharide synthase